MRTFSFKNRNAATLDNLWASWSLHVHWHPRLQVSVDKDLDFWRMADRNFYSVKTALRVGIVQMLNGLISIGIGAYNTRKEDHNAFLKFKPEGLPVWSGILVRMLSHLWSTFVWNHIIHAWSGRYWRGILTYKYNVNDIKFEYSCNLQ